MDTPQTPAQPEVARSAIRRVAWRLVPFVALMFFINYLDRTAIGFAAVGFFMLLSAALMLLLARSNRIAPIERIVDEQPAEDAHVAVAEEANRR